MKTKNNRRESLHRLLLNFLNFNQHTVKPSIANCLLFRSDIPSDLKNPVMIFLLEHSIDQVVEMLGLQLHEAWTILDQELEELGEPKMSNTDGDYLNLVRIRNKLIGHRVINSINPQHAVWYKKTFGSYEKIFEFLQGVADKIEAKVVELIRTKKMLVNVGTATRGVKRFSKADVRSLVDALKAGGAW